MKKRTINFVKHWDSNGCVFDQTVKITKKGMNNNFTSLLANNTIKSVQKK